MTAPSPPAAGTSPPPRLLVVIASTRPGRVGLPVGRWFLERAEKHGGFDVHVADLAEEGLPFLDEPKHPALRQYEHEHTKRWSAKVDAADAFVLVMPEYNFGLNAPLKNALDFVLQEWAHKPVGFVSYGGVSAGTRAMQMVKQVVSALRMVPVTDAVTIPFVRTLLADDGTLQPTELLNSSAQTMLEELARLAEALRPLRTPDPEHTS